MTVTVSPGAVSRVKSFVSSRGSEDAAEDAAKAATRVVKRMMAVYLGGDPDDEGGGEGPSPLYGRPSLFIYDPPSLFERAPAWGPSYHASSYPAAVFPLPSRVVVIPPSRGLVR